MNKIAVAVAVACLPLATPTLAQMTDVPEAVRAPTGHVMAMRAMGKGELTYECRAKATDATAFEWAFTGPNAKLMDASGKEIGKYYGGPTWEAADGSKVTGKQVAVAPSAAGNIPMQLVMSEPTTGAGSMNGITYIQRINTRGGIAPSDACNSGSGGMKKLVPYEAEYVFYKKM